MDDVTISERLPAAAEYIDLRMRLGWGAIGEATAERTIQSAAFTISLRRHDRLLGIARVMGDGALFFFLADLIVALELRGGGYGDRLMEAVTAYFDRNAKPGATIALIPLSGRESFYERFGFLRCPSGHFGPGMPYAAAPPPIIHPR